MLAVEATVLGCDFSGKLERTVAREPDVSGDRRADVFPGQGRARPRAVQAAEFARIEAWTAWLDSRYRVPHTRIHLGLDPLVGLVPIAGDLVSAAVSLYLLSVARRLGVPWSLIAKMSVNIAADALLGMIPFAGPVLDIFYRANEQNLKLLIADLQRRQLSA